MIARLRRLRDRSIEWSRRLLLRALAWCGVVESCGGCKSVGLRLRYVGSHPDGTPITRCERCVRTRIFFGAGPTRGGRVS